MAAIRRRPWLIPCIAACLALSVAGCTLIAPVESPAAQQNAADRLASDGRHAEAAQAYAALAAEPSANHDYFELRSAAQWLAAGNIAAARQAFAAVSAAARTQLPALRALLGAELALAGNDGAGALRELHRMAVPTLPDEAQEYWWLRGRAEFLADDPAAGVRAYVERERWLGSPAAVRANRDELFARIRTAAARGDSFAAPPNANPIVGGWLALGPIALELDRNPMHVSAALAEWRARFPMHPADDALQRAAQTQLRAVTQFPNQIALLLPLSGPAEAVGTAVRDGFISAYFEQDAASRPRVKIYDAAAQPVAAAYDQAIADGADFVVGPLTKDGVAALAPLAGRVPVLALNFLGTAVATPRNFYQFALYPEDEAKIVARRLIADGRMRGIAIVPQGEWGERVAGAFTAELDRLGGAVLDLERYDAAQIDFTDIIESALQIHEVKGGPATHRADAAFIFIAASPGTARLIVPQLKFHYAGDIPVYAMPDGFAADPRANSDIDGLRFADMPWMISADPVTAGIRDAVRAAWAAGTSRRDRLYAFGFDAYRLVPALRSGYFSGGAEISGMTGRLRLDGRNRIRRSLDWAKIEDGIPQPLPPRPQVPELPAAQPPAPQSPGQ
ncbi:MAG TPA: penicillin-binding protein activator [Steroidobacteraceae bacterium]|nr:penicillin-binding protein activator [Steroidobacteraceae bacterium]